MTDNRNDENRDPLAELAKLIGESPEFDDHEAEVKAALAHIDDEMRRYLALSDAEKRACTRAVLGRIFPPLPDEKPQAPRKRTVLDRLLRRPSA
ncbi:MAG TPA: hypothetical protein VJL39_02785 [Candidatus Paceibacterota bacterium]